MLPIDTCTRGRGRFFHQFGRHTPNAIQAKQPGSLLKGQLRPYQVIGVNWLDFLTNLKLGACLADDMGLGKTIQVISLLLMKKQQREKNKAIPSILVLPASLVFKSGCRT